MMYCLCMLVLIGTPAMPCTMPTSISFNQRTFCAFMSFKRL
jgi:hypothetical protein